MKSFQEFLKESDDEKQETEEIKQHLDREPNSKFKKGASHALKYSMQALARGDLSRHKYWLTRAYKAITGQTVEEE